MDPRNNVATDLFYKIRSRFKGLKLGDETGVVTINPENARFFDFDYMQENVPIGHVSISIAEPSAMKVYYSSGITEDMQSYQKNQWYGFLKELRMFAKRRLMSFDTRDIAKDNLDKRDYEFLTQNKTTKSPVGESTMTESTLYGTNRTSYQKLQDTKLIIKHSKALTDDQAPGARSRNISSLFVENSQGERFKYPFIHLAGARAMQRHVANGGLPYDEIGQSIISMSEEIAQLRSFENYVVRNDLMNYETNAIVNRSGEQLNRLRETIAKISRQQHYEEYKNNFKQTTQEEVPDEFVREFTDKFTVKNFKEDIKSVFPILYRLMKEQSTIGYDDIVAMTAQEDMDEGLDIDTYDPFAKFENWIMNLGEESAILSDDEEEKAKAVKDLQELVGEHFPAGVDGQNAIESLKGIIEDPELYNQIKEQAKEDPDSCCRGLVKDWLEQNAPDIVQQLDFGDYTEEPAADASQEEPQMSDVDQHQQKLSVQDLAEFITSFYDKESGTFPKGPEGVALMVGKKFGEQAEQIARKFVERMAPQQTTEHNPELEELARIKELARI